jgi:hypothetical protein
VGVMSGARCCNEAMSDANFSFIRTSI